jgi:hypothetical protein
VPIDLGGLLGLPLVTPQPEPALVEVPTADFESDRERLIEARCRKSLFRFFIESWKECNVTKSTTLQLGFEPPPGSYLPDRGHIKAICDHIQWQLEDAMARREDPTRTLRAQNLLINCPPRSLKTIILALASAWAWIRWPWMQILYVSATPAMILDTARIFRDCISSAWYQRLFIHGAWTIRDDQDALSSMGNTSGGARRGFGFKAKILGQNSDWLQVDDAHDMDDTPDTIKDACEHYDKNLSSRINDPSTGIRTAIMQRCARGDFSDHVLGHGWFHLRIPMEFERQPECRCPQCLLCPLGTPNAFGWVDWRWTPDGPDGEVMHPRFTPEYLAERRLVLRAHGYAGQMQQRPAPKEGNQFKIHHWRYATIDGLELPHPRPFGAREGGATLQLKRRAPDHAVAPGRLDVDWVCLSADVTGGSSNEDASALGLVGGCGKGERRIILGDYTPGPRTWGQTMGPIKLALISLANLTAWDTRIRVLVEKKALGPAAIDQLNEALGDGLHDRWGRAIHAIVEAYEPTGKGDKEQRAEVMEPMHEGGLMFLLDGAEWLCVPASPGAGVTYVDEFAAFPKGQRDDRVDATSQMIDRYRKKVSDWTKLFK